MQKYESNMEIILFKFCHLLYHTLSVCHKLYPESQSAPYFNSIENGKIGKL